MSLKQLFILILCVFSVLSFCGCENEKTKISQAEYTSNIQNIDTNILAVDDTVDPENDENQNGQGAEIDVQDLTDKKGKADGIDVSKWQGRVDWKAVKKSGIDFAIIRIGYRAENGKIYKDEYADYNIQQADKAGLLVGVYFFSTAKNKTEALEEAKWTAEAIKYYSISYPVVYDCEGFLRLDSRMYGITNSVRTENAVTFLDFVKSKGYDGMLYAAKNEIEASAYWDTALIESSYKVWVAYYPTVTYPQIEAPQYSGKFDMWQYTNMGKIDGVSGNTDMIVSYYIAERADAKSNEKPPKATVPVQKDGIYTEINEQVTAKELVNLRDAATTKSNIVGTLKNGDTLTRIAVGSNGWSKLTYSGKTVYAISSYLTTDLAKKTPVTSNAQVSDGFTQVNEQVTAKEVVNLRDAVGTTSNIVASLKNGEVATRIGINNTNGWSKISFNGKVLYAVSSYLTTDLSYKPVTSEPEVSDGYTAVNEQVTAKSETNLRSVASSKDESTVVYTLKNGEYVTRVGINSANGWSKLLYNGQTVYAITSYLTE